MKGVILAKLPPLTTESFNCSSPSSILQEDTERKGAAVKACQKDISSYNNWPIPVQRRHNSATARQKIYSEEKQNLSLGTSEMDTVFPLKPRCHKMAFNLNNCQADSDYYIPKDKKSLDCVKEHWENGEQTKRRQEKHDRGKLERFDTDSSDLSRERGETNSKSLNGCQILHKGQRSLYENEIRLTKEIQKKEVLLQEKLLKAAERLRKLQLENASRDNVKNEEQRNARKAENRLYYTEKGNWDWESARDRALRGRRHDDGQREGFDNWVRWKDGVERQNNHVKETNGGQKEKRREGIEWENRGRNTQRPTKLMEKEWDHFEKMKMHTQGRARKEKDWTKRERSMQWQGNERREWDQRDWPEETVRANDGEKRRRERALLKRDTEIDDDQQWELTDKFASKSHIKGKVVSKHDKTNVFIEDHLATQERVHQYSNRTAEEMTLKKPLPEMGPNTDNSKWLQQMQLSPESIPDTHGQLVACKLCNRHFTEDRLEKHTNICEKTQKPKRQVFDSSKYRAKGTDLEEFMKTNGRSKAPEPKKSNWRQKHEAFIQNMRQARVPAATGFQPSADLNSDYKTCPHCSRRFAPGPAERHIPKCQYIKSKPPPPRQRH